MIDVEEEFQSLLKELEADADRIPKNLARLIYTRGVLLGIKVGAELLDIVKQITEKRGD